MQTSKRQHKEEERVLILAPTGRDAELTARFLNGTGLIPEICNQISDLCHKILENAGIVFLTGEALDPETALVLINTLHRQLPWSDIPIIILTSGGGDDPSNADILAELSEAGNVTLIERPVRMMTLNSAIKSALRARRKQYETRDFLLAEIESKEELRQSEEQLRDARHRLESTLTAAEVGTWNWDCINNKVFADKNLARMFSVSEEDANGGKIGKYLQAIHSEDRERAGKIIEQVIKDGTDFHAEYRLVSPKGAICWVIARGIVERDSDGQPLMLNGVIVDITGRKEIEEDLRESEERYRNLFNSIDEGFCVIEMIFDDAGKPVDYLFLETNPMFAEQTGMENAVGKRRREITPNPEEYWFEIYGQVALTGKAIRFENGTKALNRWFDLYAFRIGKAESRKIAVLFKDITKRKLEEEERERLLKSEQEARRTAEDASRLKDEFLAVVSHELRTPLNSILGWTQMFRRRPLDKMVTERAFETIERNARSQNQLIEDLLDVSRITSGKVRLDVQPVKLVNVIESVLDSLRPAAEAREITVQKTLDEKTKPFSGDPDRLQQIIWNLLSNAIKFTSRGGKVEVRLEQKNSHIEIIVSDTGRGIEKSFLPFVFDRFRQADSSSKRQYGGLGLGLSIVRQLTELHGGTVDVASEGAGCGTTFTLSLPLMGIVSQSGYKKNSKIEKSGNSVNPAMLAGTKVLLVDDDEDTRIILSMFLEQSSAVVRSAASVPEALEFLKTETFDLLISDIEMPHQDGYDLIKLVRDMSPNKNVPAIAVTAYARNEDRLHALAAGYNMHIPKPIDSDRLLTIIKRLVEQKS